MNSNINSNKSLLAWAVLILLALTWGSSFILIKRGLDAFNPFDLGAIRLVLAGLCLLPFAFKFFSKVEKSKWKYLIIIGLIGNGIPAFLFPYAETVISSASAGILNTLTPIFVLIVGVTWYGMPFASRKLFGILLGLSGSVILISAGGSEVNIVDHILYSGLIILACIGYAVSSNMIKAHLNDTHPIAISVFSIVAMAIPYAFYLVWRNMDHSMMDHPLAWQSLGYVFILAFFGTAMALILFYRLVQMTDPIFTSSVTYLIPIVALGWGILDGEIIMPLQLVGMGIIFLGVYLVNRS